VDSHLKPQTSNLKPQTSNLKPQTSFKPSAQVLLDEARTEVHVDLDERLFADAVEAVDLAGLDDVQSPRPSLTN
jgi:hypothetical protein